MTDASISASKDKPQRDQSCAEASDKLREDSHSGFNKSADAKRSCHNDWCSPVGQVLQTISTGATMGVTLEVLSQALDKQVSRTQWANHNFFQREWASWRPHVSMPPELITNWGLSKGAHNSAKKALLESQIQFSSQSFNLNEIHRWQVQQFHSETNALTKGVYEKQVQFLSELADELDVKANRYYKFGTASENRLLAERMANAIGSDSEVLGGKKLFAATSVEGRGLKQVSDLHLELSNRQATFESTKLALRTHHKNYLDHRVMIETYRPPSPWASAAKGAVLAVGGLVVGEHLDHKIGASLGYEPSKHSNFKILLDGGLTPAVLLSSMPKHYKAAAALVTIGLGRAAAWAGI